MKKTIRKRLLYIFLALVLLGGLELFRSNEMIKVSRYYLSSENISSPFRIVFLSDLHGKEFGKDNARLIKRISGQKPDMIALDGDIFNHDADEKEINAMCGFIKQCSQIAPVFFSLGNHEAAYLKYRGTGLIDRITEAGATVVDTDYVDTSMKGNPFRIGGYKGYFGSSLMTTEDPAQQKLEGDFFVEFKDTKRFKIMLNHIPTGWLDWHYIDNDSIDLVLCGHYHGGIIRIPFFEQGLYAPYVGKFPPYTKGMYVGEKATCILTTGLTGSYGFLRFFNAPEICTVDIFPQNKNFGQ